MSESTSSDKGTVGGDNPSFPARTPGGFLGMTAIGALALVLVAGGALVQAGVAAQGLRTVASVMKDDRPGPRRPAADRRLPFGNEEGPMGRRGGRPDRMPEGGPGSMPGLAGIGGIPVHGDVVVNDPNAGGTTTIRFARGEVTAVSATSLTLKCSDGFEATFAIDGNTKVRLGDDQRTITDLKTGGTAMATGRVAGEVTTATLVTDSDPGRRPGRGSSDTQQ